MTDLTEIWVPIPNYIGLYEVSNLGRVKSLTRYVMNGKFQRVQYERILKQSWGGGNRAYNNNGQYLGVLLCNNGKESYRSVHTLVLLAFRGPRPKGYESMFLDKNRENIQLDNLDYQPCKGRDKKFDKTFRLMVHT